MAYTIGINKNMGQMFADLETLMLQEGWEKNGLSLVNNFITSRGYSYTGTGYAVEGKYPDTVGISLQTSSNYFKHANYAGQSSPSVTYYNDFPQEFSLSFWFKFGGFKLGGESGRGFYSNFLYGPIASTDKRKGIDLVLDKYSALGDWASFDSVLYLMENYFLDKTGMSYEHITITYSQISKTRKLYINGVLVGTEEVPVAYATFTEYGVIYQVGGSYQHSCVFDELIVWNKVLSAEEVLTLFNKPTKVEATDSFVFEKYTHDVGVLLGGTFTSYSTQGTPTTISITQNSSYNIELKTFTFMASNTTFGTDYYVTNVVGQEGTSRVLCGVPPKSTILKKYWLVVSKDQVIIAFKLHDSSASRPTPLYQLGYCGKITSLGNDGISILTAGTTTSTSRLWTTIDTANFGSGLMLAANSSFRAGSSYITPTVGHISTNLSALTSISSSAFLSGINLSSGTNALGSVTGVFVVSTTQASPEDLITINGVDFVVLPNADLGAGQYYLVLKLQ